MNETVQETFEALCSLMYGQVTKILFVHIITAREYLL